LKKRVRYLSLDDVYLIVEELRRAYLRDFIRVMNRGVIESALEAARYAGSGLRSFRARVAAKAATLLFLLVTSHPLTDGNKRFTHLVVEAFLEVNGYSIRPDVLEALILDAASLSVGPEGIYKVLYRSLFRG